MEPIPPDPFSSHDLSQLARPIDSQRRRRYESSVPRPPFSLSCEIFSYLLPSCRASIVTQQQLSGRPFPFYSIQHALSILFASGSGSSKLTRHTSSIDSFRCALICASMLCVFGVNSAMLLTGDTERELAGWRERSVVRRLRT